MYTCYRHLAVHRIYHTCNNSLRQRKYEKNNVSLLQGPAARERQVSSSGSDAGGRCRVRWGLCEEVLGIRGSGGEARGAHRGGPIESRAATERLSPPRWSVCTDRDATAHTSSRLPCRRAGPLARAAFMELTGEPGHVAGVRMRRCGRGGPVVALGDCDRRVRIGRAAEGGLRFGLRSARRARGAPGPGFAH